MAAPAEAATLIGIGNTIAIITAIGIVIVTAIEMTTVMDIMTVDCIADGTNTIATTRMIGMGIMIAAACITTTIRITNGTMTVKIMTTITTISAELPKPRFTARLVRVSESKLGNRTASREAQLSL